MGDLKFHPFTKAGIKAHNIFILKKNLSRLFHFIKV